MADAFSHVDTKFLLAGKHIMFLGDSNIRAHYKDLVWLLNSNTLVTHVALRRKLEFSYLKDQLIQRSDLNYGRDFQEVRSYSDKSVQTKVDFMFISRCYNRHLENLFSDIHNRRRPVPDVIVMNSCLWDLTRWGPNGVPEYKDNLVRLMRLMRHSLPKECLVIWTTALPTAAHVRGGLLIKQIECMEPMLRFEVVEANMFARDVVVSHGFDVLDNHYHTRMQMHRRARDGVHYMPVPVRLMTNLLLTHIALSWGRELPQNISSMLLDKAIAQACKGAASSVPVAQVPTTGLFSKIQLTSPVMQRTKGLKVTFNANQEHSVRQCKLFQDEAPFYQQPCHSQPEPQMSMITPREWSEQDHVRHHDQGPSHSRTGPYRRKNNHKRKGPYHDNRYNYRY